MRHDAFRTGSAVLNVVTFLACSLFASQLNAQDQATVKRASAPTQDNETTSKVVNALGQIHEALVKSGRARPSRPPGNLRALEPRPTVGLVPLTELGQETYKGQQGGLYPGGSNRRPQAHEEAGLRQAKAIRPLDRQGQPSDDGAIVLLSIGMSNTTQEFSTFQRLAKAEPTRNPKLVIVDGAQGGMAANVIVATDSPRGQQFWTTVDQRLRDAGVSPLQVQAAWIKQADIAPRASFPDDAKTLQGELERIVRILHEHYPNLRIAYLSSRIYGGYARTRLNPEPFAYQSGFAVKWLIERQIGGAAELNFDPERGPVQAPWLAWGPYLWADGTRPRSDGLVYESADFAQDGTHPAPNGAREKVAKRLLDFLKTDSTARPWFLKPE